MLLQAAAVFVFFKYRRYDSPRWNGIMQKMGKYSFGAYLVHPFFQERLHEGRVRVETKRNEENAGAE